MQPFNHLIITQTMTGAQIKNVLEQQFAGFAGQTVRRILQVSAGFMYFYSESAALGSRVSDMDFNGVPIDPAATYRVTCRRLPGQWRRRFQELHGWHSEDCRARVRRPMPWQPTSGLGRCRPVRRIASCGYPEARLGSAYAAAGLRREKNPRRVGLLANVVRCARTSLIQFPTY